jgi:hypothetical protein
MNMLVDIGLDKNIPRQDQAWRFLAKIQHKQKECERNGRKPPPNRKEIKQGEMEKESRTERKSRARTGAMASF